MRQSILYSLIVGANLVGAVVEGTLFEGDSHGDWKEFAKDKQKNLEDLGSHAADEVRNTIAEAWPIQEHRPWWKFWSSKSSGTSSWGTSSNQPVSDWLFDTWSLDGLRNFLKKHGVKVSPQATKDQLVQSAKDNYDSIAEKLGKSDILPADYFEHWSTDDFKTWLKEYEIPFEEKQEEMLNKVRDNIYHVSKDAEQKRLETLRSLDFANRQIFDKAGDIKKDVFDSWSADDLEKWLNSHKVAYSDQIEGNRDELAALASDQKELLKDDIKWYLEAAKKKASPLVSKSPEYVSSLWEKTLLGLGAAYNKITGKVDNVINDTFLVDLDGWPREKIIEYLEARGVSYCPVATNEHLRNLAREFRNRPLKKAQEGYEKVADGEWYEDAKEWVKDKSDEVQNSETYNSLHDGFEALGKDTQNWASDVGRKVQDDYNSWSVEDLKAYLKNMGGSASSSSMSKDDLIKLIKEKTLMVAGIHKQPWYEKWASNTKYWLSRAYSMVVSS
ncbi:related to Meiotic sister chromatid recombination protein 1 [Zygosaccharomyces bailii]|nr:related to Meiotic sister chromatid recombination protein 1 [Zygosaccharomyces bailii]